MIPPQIQIKHTIWSWNQSFCGGIEKRLNTHLGVRDLVVGGLVVADLAAVEMVLHIENNETRLKELCVSQAGEFSNMLMYALNPGCRNFSQVWLPRNYYQCQFITSCLACWDVNHLQKNWTLVCADVFITYQGKICNFMYHTQYSSAYPCLSSDDIPCFTAMLVKIGGRQITNMWEWSYNIGWTNLSVWQIKSNPTSTKVEWSILFVQWPKISSSYCNENRTISEQQCHQKLQLSCKHAVIYWVMWVSECAAKPKSHDSQYYSRILMKMPWQGPGKFLGVGPMFMPSTFDLAQPSVLNAEQIAKLLQTLCPWSKLPVHCMSL